MLLGAFCLIAILVMGVLGCVNGSPIGGLAAKNVKPVPLTPMEQAQKDYASVTITYQIGDASEVLDSDRILSWLRENEDGSVAFDEQQARAFVKSLAEKYDTAYTTRTFHTTTGRDIQIAQGDYGWCIDQDAETEHLLELLSARESATCEPIYAQTATVHAKNDWGTSYVEVSLTDQYLWLYKDGKCILESYFVSGNPTRGHATPRGIYGLTYKTRNATLSGEGYNSKVKYWMPFNRNVGLHDAPWRSSFGGQIYRSNGSHGCINLPPANAVKIYENVEKNTPVIVY